MPNFLTLPPEKFLKAAKERGITVERFGTWFPNSKRGCWLGVAYALSRRELPTEAVALTELPRLLNLPGQAVTGGVDGFDGNPPLSDDPIYLLFLHRGRAVARAAGLPESVAYR